jgi:hypothetical protein
MTLEGYFTMAIGGFFTGIGVTVGGYFANKHLIEKMSEIMKGVKVNDGNKTGTAGTDSTTQKES